ncbi:MAG: hypothetical protein SO119_08090 [Phascolarctobacterium sp.]|nr:hypothetical protein [Phascolarctobacterium sp.]
METISLIAVPKFSDWGLETQVLYKVRGNITKKNPLNRLQDGQVVTQKDLLFLYEKAKEIEDAFLRVEKNNYSFRKRHTYLDRVELTSPELIKEYESLGLGMDRRLYNRKLLKLSLKQKLLDLEALKLKCDKLFEFCSDHYYSSFTYKFNPHLKAYIEEKIRTQEAAINILRYKLEYAELESMESFIGACSERTLCSFAIGIHADRVKPIVRTGSKRKGNPAPLQLWREVALDTYDTSANRLALVMAHIHFFLLPGYDIVVKREEVAEPKITLKGVA